MKAPSSLAPRLALPAVARMGPHLNTRPAPSTPPGPFACMSSAGASLGDTVPTSQPDNGVLAAEKRDPSSPHRSECGELRASIHIHKNDDGQTRYRISGGRAKASPDGERITSVVVLRHADGQAVGEVTKRCG